MDSYYVKNLMVKITEKQRLMLGLMVEILGEKRSEMVRRLIMDEAKRTAALLDGEELELWLELINNIERENDYHEFEVGRAISNGMREGYYEKTGGIMDNADIRKLKTNAEKQKMWQRNHRARVKMAKLKELEEKWNGS